MTKNFPIILILLFLIISITTANNPILHAQEKSIQDSIKNMDENILSDSIHSYIIMDERIEKLMQKPKVLSTRMRGYRVQIYNGNNRQEAESIRNQFLRNHPTTPAYLIYSKPNFRVRVGNFKNRQEAQEMIKKINNQFPSMIVPEVIFRN
ncbi:MAG TPA: SPOR domain-containing protein [Chitinophagaceae bacterium]|nr:SPOR domain-containing protein [Chitinophagaceae bacterium]